MTGYAPHDVTVETGANGHLLMQARAPLGPVARNTGAWLHDWADAAPDRVFIAERSGAGWREETYGAVLEQVRALAGGLLARGMGAGTPILFLSGNSVDHAFLMLAAQYVGVPTVPVAEQYALIPAAHERLREVVELVRPAMVYAGDERRFAEALALDMFAGVGIVAGRAAFADLMRAGTDGLDAAHADVGPDTIAKILMTSGSTSSPKGVMTTHRMLCANQTQIAQGLPFLRDRPPRIVDWLPWNHVFGGSHNVNMMLANGGSLYIDDGKPARGLFDRTVENLSMVAGTLCFNVPVGFGLLLEALKADAALRQRFFGELELIFYAGASLPQEIWAGFEAMALDIRGKVPLLTSSWGLTETAPACVMQQVPTDRAGVVGVPLPGVDLRLIPDEDGRFEARVKGPNVMPGYLHAPDKTAEAFDEDGYFITGDALRFVDPDDPNKGLRFDGRIAEDFKLLTGTWVRAAQLRLTLLGVLAPLAADIVVTGADRGEVGLLIFPNAEALAAYDTHAQDGALMGDTLRAEIARRLGTHAASAGSSSRIARALVLAEPASMPEGEATAKGNLNPRKILTRRAALLSRLYNDADPALIRPEDPA